MKQSSQNIAGIQFNLSQYSDDNAPSFEQLFNEFVEQLNDFSSRNVILSDPYFLSINEDKVESLEEDWPKGLAAEDRSKLILMSVLCLPADFSDLGASSQILYSESILPSDVTLPLPNNAVIETLSSEFYGTFSIDQTYWQIADWSSEWAIVYNLTSALSDKGYLVPCVLGFCRKQQIESNFITLLQSGSELFDWGIYCTYGEVFGSWKLASLALQVLPDDEAPAWDVIQNLQSLDADILEAVINDDSLDDQGGFLSRVRSILVSADDNGLGSLSLEELMKKAGGKPSLSSIEEQLPKWEREHDKKLEHERKRKAEEKKVREEKLQFARQRIDAWTLAICGENPKQQWPGFAWRARFRRVQAFIEDHILAENSFPSGKHDLGSVDFMSGELTIGIIDFDEVASAVQKGQGR